HSVCRAEGVHVPEARVRIAAAEETPELGLPFLGARGEPTDLLLVPAGPAHLRGIRALAGRGNDPPIDHQVLRVGMEAELSLHPRALPRRHVLVPHRGGLPHAAAAGT